MAAGEEQQPTQGPDVGLEDEIGPETDVGVLRERLQQIRDSAESHPGWSAAVAVGATAAIVAGIVVARRRGVLRTPSGSRLFIKSGDRHTPGVVSVVEFTEPRGQPSDIAASFPVSSRAARLLAGRHGSKELFSMGGSGYIYPQNGAEEVEAYNRGPVRRVAGWLLNVLQSSDSEAGT